MNTHAQRTTTRGLRPRLVGTVVGAALTAIVLGVMTGTSGPARAAEWTPLRVNVGASATYTDRGGNVWSPDATDSRFTLNGTRSSTTNAVAGTDDDPIYQRYRWGLTYFTANALPSGTYNVRLHFNEPAMKEANRRVFSVNAEGNPWITNLDLYAAGGGNNRALVRSTDIAVTDGTLNLTFSASRNYAILQGIEVTATGTTSTTTSTTAAPTTTSATTSTTTSTTSTTTSTTTTSTTTAPTSTTTTTLPTDPAAVNFTPTSGRPFRNDSPWNVTIPTSPVLDAKSASIVSWMTANPKSINAAYDEFGHPIFDANIPGQPATPTSTVDCTMNWGTCKLEAQPVPIPSNAVPQPGSDATMVIVDWASMRSFDFWQAKKVSSNYWTTSWGTVTDLKSSGAMGGGTTGAGVPRIAGVIRVREIRAGAINHALAIGTTNACKSVFRYPATKTDGWSTATDCVPEGTRIQLDPSINVDALPGITKAEKAVAKAMQKYGAYVMDNAGSAMGFGFERIDPADLLAGECATAGASCNPYVAAGLPWDYYHMPNIPWSRIRVLNSWNGS